MGDEQIIALYWDRNEEAIAASSACYGTYCRTIAEGILHSFQDAEECVNDTWLHAWNAIPPRKPSRLRLFFGKITRNLALSRYRQLHAEKRGGGQLPLVLDELAECAGGTADVETEAELHRLRECLHRFLEGLSQRELHLFLSRYFYLQEIPEIAARCGLSKNNVTVILSRTRKKLRDYLHKEGYDL